MTLKMTHKITITMLAHDVRVANLIADRSVEALRKLGYMSEHKVEPISPKPRPPGLPPE